MTPLNILKKHYGYDSFRGEQERIIDSILNNKDTVGIMPTGAGKSVCFQIPSLLFENITLVISPLISLMNDQVIALRQLGISAVSLNSSISNQEMWQVLEDIRYGEYKLIYISPERLSSPRFINFIQTIKIDMVSIDEAHCISQWGQDFRPSYMNIPEFIDQLSHRPIISVFTATATSKVRDDIINILKLNNPAIYTTGFDRKNLFFAVDRISRKIDAVQDYLKKHTNESGIIYCSSRKNVDSLTSTLQDLGYKATSYHAGLSDYDRMKNQEDFLYDRATIMVATNAFGMGIDKSNVSYVIHYNMPKDIESYYQEAGRAGRDGREALCLLLFSKQDIVTNKWLIENKRKDTENTDPEQVGNDINLKNIQYKRLDVMIGYSSTNTCLRNNILRYFGETPENDCGKCSNCYKFKNIQLVDVTVDSQKIISCIKRMDQKYGAKMVIDVLRGSKSAKVKNNELDKLSTYNITQTSSRTLEDIIEYLIEEEYVYRETGQYPILKLGRRYKELLAKDALIKAPISIKNEVKEQVETNQTKNKDELSPEKLVLYEKLKDLCKDIAKEEGVPAFYVFMDKTLIDMAEKEPKTEDEFLDVVGVGEAKLKRYGEKFINLILKEAV